MSYLFPTQLEEYLLSKQCEYFEYSSKNYTAEQRKYNNGLTRGLLDLAADEGYVFQDFTFSMIRDRIRCYYKSHSQLAKKKRQRWRKNTHTHTIAHDTYTHNTWYPRDWFILSGFIYYIPTHTIREIALVYQPARVPTIRCTNHQRDCSRVSILWIHTLYQLNRLVKSDLHDYYNILYATKSLRGKRHAAPSRKWMFCQEGKGW